MKTSPQKGFALIASLTLMMLLGLIAVGVLAVASSQNRSATYAALQTQARQQALMGLDAALAEMQLAVGPDQRVTASSGILGEEGDVHQHILGVWNSWKHALYSTADQGIAQTYTPGRRSSFRRWLISAKEPTELSEMDSIRHLGKQKPGSRICLVGEGSLGKRNADVSQYVYADLIDMPAGNNNTASYAWWVSGENQKALVTMEDREPTTDETELLRRTWDTPAPSFASSPSLSFLDSLTAEEKQKLITRKTLGAIGAHQDTRSTFFDITIFSRSLLTNVRDGGLKMDLNLLLTKEKLDNTPFARRADQDCPLAEDEDMPAGSEPNMPIGSWQVMHDWYNTWPNGSASANEALNARLVGTVHNAYTTLSGDMVEATTPKGESVTYFDTKSLHTARAGYARAPILTTFLGCWGLSVSQTVYRKGHTLHYLYSPMTMWWNPYNVQMRVGAKKLWMYTMPYRTTCVQAWSERAEKEDPQRPWCPKLMMHPCSGNGVGIPWQCCFRLDWGNYFVNSLTDTTGDIIFEPGEILCFTMSGNVWSVNEVDSVGNPQDCPFIVGDQPGEMTHYRTDYNEYVNVTNPAANSVYDTYIDHFSARLTLEDKKNPFFTGSIVYGIASSEKQGDYLVTMGEVLQSGAEYDDTDHTHVPGREAFSVVYGYDGIHVSLKSGLDERRRKAQVDGFSGAKGISPSSFNLGWYDYESMKADDMLFLKTKWNVNMLGTKPIYYVAVGIVPKSYNQIVNEGFPGFKGKDYRTKSWQHSSPALWGSALYKPDDQMRQYHPYQLAAIELGAGVNRGPLDTVNGRNGVYGLFSAGVGGGENVSFISVLELPIHPPFSLAGFAGMRLTPGWYKPSKSVSNRAESIARRRRNQYQAGVPGVGIGNSFADPCLPANAVYVFHENKANESIAYRSSIFSDFYDHALIINDELWDRWFCSSISDMPMGGAGLRSARMVITDFIQDKEPLPVSRYKKSTNGLKQEDVIAHILADDGWMHIARYLVIEGGFNINSVSEEAWAATLQGLAKRELMSNSGTRLRKIEKTSNHVLFSRFMASPSNKPIDGLGYDPLQGSSSIRPSLKMATAWGEVRSLDPNDIRTLAREIVKIVRERGPFLNMSDFINRRLDGGSDHALKGALQAAIDATNINEMFTDESYNIKVQKSGSLYRYPKAAEGSIYTAAPGYLIQSDVLSSLGNILTVRDDTFTVRAYGCVRNSRNAVLAQAWCEATVQRTLEYVDPSNAPDESDRSDRVIQKTKGIRRLSELNRVMGRKLKVISFRWLDYWDI